MVLTDWNLSLKTALHLWFAYQIAERKDLRTLGFLDLVVGINIPFEIWVSKILNIIGHFEHFLVSDLKLIPRQELFNVIKS